MQLPGRAFPQAAERSKYRSSPPSRFRQATWATQHAIAGGLPPIIRTNPQVQLCLN